MTQWDYQITLHQLPLSPCDEGEVIECDQGGQCFVHDACRGGLGKLENLFREKGKEGWELAQSGYHQRTLLCIWKREIGG